MKYLILMLLTFNAYAEFKVEFIETSTGGTYHFEKQDEAKAKEHLLKIIKKSQWMKGEWKLTPESSLVKIEEYTDAVDTGETKTIQDMEGNDVEVPVYEYVDKTRNLYYHPTNFTYTISDITQELADKAAQKAIDDARIDEIKVKDKDKMKLDELVELLKLKGII